MPTKIEIPKEYYDWRLQPVEVRITRSQIAHKCRISVPQTYKWDKQIESIVPDNIEERIRIWDEQLYMNSIKSGTTAEMMKLFGVRHGLLIDKSEQKVILLSADELFRIRSEAQRGVEQFNRDRKVQPKPALLPENIREDT